MRFIILCLVLSILSFQLTLGQSQEIDSIKNLLLSSTDTARVNLLNVLSYKLVFSAPQEAEKSARESIQLAEQINFKRGQAKAYQVLGISFDLRSNYSDAVAVYDSGIRIVRQLDTVQYVHRELYAGLLNGLGVAYYRQSNYQEAITYLLKGLVIAETFPNRSRLAVLSMNMGLVYFDQKEFDKAIDYFNRGLKFGEESGNKSVVGRAANNIGIIYKEKGEYNDAIRFYKLSLKIKRELNDVSGVGSTLNNIGIVYKRLGRYDEAMKHLQEASEIALHVDDKLNMTLINDTKAEIYILKKQYGLAKELIDTSYKLVKEIDTREPMLLVYERYMELYKTQGQFEKAMEWQDRKVKLADSLFTEKKSQQIAELETRYETEKKDRTIQLLKRDNQIHRMWTTIWLGVCLLVSGVSLMGYFFQRYRENKNRRILNLKIDNLIAQRNELSEKYRGALVSGLDSTVESYDQVLLKKSLDIIEANISNPQFGVDQMADIIGMSRASLHRKLKAITGFPPSEFIRNIRLRKAAALLSSQADSVSQIGIAVGFEDQSYFSKSFKKQFGVPPSEYMQATKLVETLQ